MCAVNILLNVVSTEWGPDLSKVLSQLNGRLTNLFPHQGQKVAFSHNFLLFFPQYFFTQFSSAPESAWVTTIVIVRGMNGKPVAIGQRKTPFLLMLFLKNAFRKNINDPIDFDLRMPCHPQISLFFSSFSEICKLINWSIGHVQKRQTLDWVWTWKGGQLLIRKIHFNGFENLHLFDRKNEFTGFEKKHSWLTGRDFFHI